MPREEKIHRHLRPGALGLSRICEIFGKRGDREYFPKSRYGGENDYGDSAKGEGKISNEEIRDGATIFQFSRSCAIL